MERRDFLNLLISTSVVFASSCKRKSKFFLQKVNKSVSPNLNNKLQFATTFPNKFLPLGIIVETFEDKPFHIFGNENHPNNRGVLQSYVLPSLYNLYDPLRFYNPQIEGKDTNIHLALNSLLNKIDRSIRNQKDIIFVIPEILSPSLFALITELKSYYNNFYFFSSSNLDTYTNQILANEVLFGISDLLLPDFSDTDIILNIGSDFLSSEVFTPFYLSRIDLKKTKIITLENTITLTGMNSQYRFLVSDKEYINILLYLLNNLSKQSGDKWSNSFNLLPIKPSINSTQIVNEVCELLATGGRVKIIIDPFQAPQLHLLGYLLEYYFNENQGIERWILPLTDYRNIISFSFEEFQQRLYQNKIGNLIFFDSNPFDWVYTEIISQIHQVSKENCFVFSYFPNHFYKLGYNWIPTMHYLEFWQDYLNIDKSISIQQPIVFPLHKNSISLNELLNFVLEKLIRNSEPIRLFDFIKKYYSKYFQDDENFFSSIKSGLFEIESRKIKPDTIRFNRHNLNRAYKFILSNPGVSTNITSETDEIRLSIKLSNKFLDGSYSSNPFLLELPDPIFGVSWDDFVVINEKYAKKNQLSDGDIVEITNESTKKSVRIPIIVNNSISSDSSLVYLGCGSFYKNLILQQYKESPLQVLKFSCKKFYFENRFYSYLDLDNKIIIRKTGEKSTISRILSFANISSFKNLKQILQNDNDKVTTIYPKRTKIEKWQLEIDLDNCIGCNICLLGCQLENNIPLIGREGISKHRDMYWIRIEKFLGENNFRQYYFLPIMCQQCDYAPCESVCPVGATSHSDDGINEMTYNRCIGSRFCMANCPYKVRKFNFDRYDRAKINSLGDYKNPDVTIRSIGVSEKCNFCLHRIRDFQSKEKYGNNVKPNSLKTACQEVCPTNAIKLIRVLNVTNDTNQRKLLANFNTKPNVVYRVKIND